MARRLLAVALTALCGSWSLSVNAASIDVDNPSFEADILDEGAENTGPVDGWTHPEAGTSGVRARNLTWYPDGSSGYRGKNNAFLDGEAELLSCGGEWFALGRTVLIPPHPFVC